MTATDDAPVWQKTACILCECNCGLEVALDGRRLAKIRGDKQHPESQGYTCEKPLRLDYYQNGRHRLDTPMRRRPDGSYEPIDWETALDEIAARLRAVKAEHGGERIAFYGGGGQGNHLGGAHGRALMNALGVTLYSNALAQEKTGEAWVDELLYGSHTAGDFERSEVAVFVGKNPWQSHGVARSRPTLRELARDPRRSMVVIDPRRSETAELADFHLQVRPGTDAWCLAGMVATLAQEDLVAHAWLAAHTVGAETVLAHFQAIDIPACAAACGVEEDLIRAAARRIADAESVATYEDLGVQMAPNSTVVSYLQKMLWILRGSYATPGGMHMHSWLFPIAGHWYPVDRHRRLARQRVRRSVGLAAMSLGSGAMRHGLALAARRPGTAKAATTVATGMLDAFFEATAVPIAADISARVGMCHAAPETTPVSGARVIGGLMPASALADEILSDHPDRVRAVWVEASNPVHSLPESDRLRRAFEQLELSVVIDVAMTETARCADYVLPAASQFEKWEASLFTLHFPHNAFQLRAPLMSPLPGTRPEAEIYAAVLDRLGAVEPGLLDQLGAAARIGPEAYALAFFASLRARPELRGLTPYLLHRTLGPTLGAGNEAAATVWGLAQIAAIAHPEGLSRAGFDGAGFRKGQALFEAILEHREGVTFTVDAYDDAWGYVRHEDGRFHLVVPELLEEITAVLAAPVAHTSAEFPLVLSAGERRSFTANVIIRNPEWRRRDAEGALRISPADAEALGLADGGRARVVTESGTAETLVEVTDIMQAGHVSLPNGLGVDYPGEDGESVVGVPLNQLTTNSRRDRFWGTPWHKHVPARVEAL